MRSWFVGGLAFALGLVAAGAFAEEVQWRPAAQASLFPAQAAGSGVSPAPAVTLGRPVPLATLGRPVPIQGAALAASDGSPHRDEQLTRASYTPVPVSPRPIVRAQAPDYSGPSLTPPPAFPPIPPPPADPYNAGVVTDPPPPAGSPFLGKVHDWLGLPATNPGCARAPFESDHAFDTMIISPVTNPFLAEDPRSLTEVRPIFMQQGAPAKHNFLRGGDIEFFGLQARLALTERLSLVLNKAGFDWIESHNSLVESHVGFSEIWLGPKYTFIRNENTGTLAAAGLTFQIPAGSAKVFQDTGDLSLAPYVSFGQNFGRSSYGSFNFLDTTGYTFGVDNKRTDYFFTSAHLDFDVANLHKIYPLVELNYFHYTSAGNVLNRKFEGRDLFNLGSTGVSGHDDLTIAAGFRFKFSECVQTGLAAEFPLLHPRDLLDYRITADLIFRF